MSRSEKACAFAASLAMVWLFPGSADARELSFEDRVRAQEAIERVYYSHQIGATKPFEEVVPRAVLEKQVQTYLKQSVALEKFWGTPVTEAMLQAELRRIVRSTRLPDRLVELYRALESDPFVIKEVLARRVLVDRLTRIKFEQDERIHGQARRDVQTLWEAQRGRSLGPLKKGVSRTVTAIGSELAESVNECSEKNNAKAQEELYPTTEFYGAIQPGDKAHFCGRWSQCGVLSAVRKTKGGALQRR